MFNSLSHETQSILMIIGIALLFLIVMANNRKNRTKNSDRRRRNFREGYEERKKDKQ